MKWLASVGLLFLVAVIANASDGLTVKRTGNAIQNSTDVVAFDLPSAGHEAAETHVFTLEGGEVAQLSATSIGHYLWDGRDWDNQPVPSGLYFVQIRHHGEVWHGPVMVNRVF